MPAIWGQEPDEQPLSLHCHLGCQPGFGQLWRLPFFEARQYRYEQEYMQ